MNMFLFRLRLRKSRLELALREYPLYDPPHKVEERLLSRDEAAENFAYFMRVRLDRLAHFRNWLSEQFGFEVSLDEKGIRALSRWGIKYAGLLLAKGADGYPTMSYFTYDPSWTGENVGYNVVFDMGITFGEAILANCPKLRWDFDPISAILPNEAKLLKETSGMSFQRPLIYGFENPAYEVTPLHKVYDFAFSMMVYMTSAEGNKRFHRLHRFNQRLACDALGNLYRQALKNYPEADSAGLLRDMGTEEYLKLVDDEVNKDNPNE
jgi:hypothetical protein